jgi:hypothetical protein
VLGLLIQFDGSIDASPFGRDRRAATTASLYCLGPLWCATEASMPLTTASGGTADASIFTRLRTPGGGHDPKRVFGSALRHVDQATELVTCGTTRNALLAIRAVFELVSCGRRLATRQSLKVG